ncbi:serine/threonine-protein kinase PknD [Folsomia candida]|uniref:Cyclin-dependent kinase 9-B n=1 Tax=Folsomia candida TaxID=158441 RepID=A0A226DDE6_FOLCA|nr:serine/threonine-protein kinase PknD [Folsomia candida]XP_035714938.1 serine/threonine-protein kinase PknD [Folsomia candida]OXA43140.1 Cyclin-dependent kinase 9-B [Folsomia candida]
MEPKAKKARLTSTRPTVARYFECVSCLGRGSFGIVMEAWAKLERSACAIKFIFPDKEDDEELKKILRECEITENLKPHENVVRIIKVSRDEYSIKDLNRVMPNKISPSDKGYLGLKERWTILGVSLDEGYLGLKERCRNKLKGSKTILGVSIQMELCGEDLRKWLNNEILAPSINLLLVQILVIKDMVAGLAHLHKNSILHRDFKPENVMFAKSNFTLPVKIGDFGLCRNLRLAESQNSTLTSRMGTVDYMAPESYGRDYSFPADLYSLGLVIWEVCQLLKSNEKKRLFDRLVNDKEEHLVVDHLEIQGVQQLILDLTKRGAGDRIQSIDEVSGIVEAWTFKINLVARNGEELEEFLKSPVPGLVITLIEGMYSGKFETRGENVTIIGKGEQTIIKGEFYIYGTGNKISNLKFQQGEVYKAGLCCLKVYGNKNKFHDISLSDGSSGIVVTGHHNQFEGINISHMNDGMIISGSYNEIDRVILETILSRCISLEYNNSCNNTICNVTGNNITSGICSSGQGNSFKNISFTKGNGYGGYGVLLFHDAKFNKVENFTCTGFTEEGSALNISSNSCTALHGKCDSIKIASNDVVLEDVDGGEIIEIDNNCTGVELRRCEAKLLRRIVRRIPKYILQSQNLVE